MQNLQQAIHDAQDGLVVVVHNGPATTVFRKDSQSLVMVYPEARAASGHLPQTGTKPGCWVITKSDPSQLDELYGDSSSAKSSSPCIDEEDLGNGASVVLMHPDGQVIYQKEGSGWVIASTPKYFQP